VITLDSDLIRDNKLPLKTSSGPHSPSPSLTPTLTLSYSVTRASVLGLEGVYSTNNSLGSHKVHGSPSFQSGKPVLFIPARSLGYSLYNLESLVLLGLLAGDHRPHDLSSSNGLYIGGYIGRVYSAYAGDQSDGSLWSWQARPCDILSFVLQN
jgi:hypothetical protein